MLATLSSGVAIKAADEPREAGVGFAIRTHFSSPSLEPFQKGSTTGWWPCASHWQATSTSPSSAHTSRRWPTQRRIRSNSTKSSGTHSTQCQEMTSCSWWVTSMHAVAGTREHGPSSCAPMAWGEKMQIGFCCWLFWEEGLTITNTLFKQPEIHKVTWMHPHSKHWHLIDYVITRRHDIRDILITRAMRGADCWTDHVLLWCKAAFQLARKHRRQASSTKKKLEVKKLSEPQVQDAIKDVLASNLPANLQADYDLEAAWSSFRYAVYNTAKSVLGHPRKKHQDWFNENNQEILSLLAEKTAADAAWLSDKDCTAKNDRFKKLWSEAQSKTRQMKDAWWAAKAEDLQGYADQHSTRLFFSGLRAVNGPPSSAVTPIRASVGTLLTEKAHMLERWTAHLSQLLNKTSSVKDQAIQDISQRPLVARQQKQRPSRLSCCCWLERPLAQMKYHPKSSRWVVRHLLSSLSACSSSSGREGMFPETPRTPTSFTCIRTKVKKSPVTTTEASHSSALLASSWPASPWTGSPNTFCTALSESQCGFRQSRRTVDMIFAICQLQAKCLEQRQDLYLLFIDPTKAFDTISRPGLWSILSKLGCPPKFISMVRSLHDGMMARVIENGDVSDPFPVTNGVKQGCVLAPTLFSLHAVCWNIVCGARQDQCWHHDPLQKWRALLWSAATESQHQSARSSSCLQTIVHWPLTPKRTYNAWLTVSLLLPRPSAWQSALIKKTEVLCQAAMGMTQPEPAIKIDEACPHLVA